MILWLFLARLIDDFPLAFTSLTAPKALFRNGEALLGALQFFTDNLSTLVFTTMEDTVESWREYEAKRLEFDAERHSITAMTETSKSPQRLQEAKVRCRMDVTLPAW